MDWLKSFFFLYLVFGHGTHYKRADHSRKCADSIGDAHQYAGIPWRNVQVVHIKTLLKRTINEHRKMKST